MSATLVEDLATPTDTATPVAARYHAFDSQRAAMMLLGIVMHMGLCYLGIPRIPAWPWSDERSTVVAALLIMGSGLFRMAAFFVMAGFFAAMTHRRRGLGDLLRTRAVRLIVPFVVGWLIVFPALWAGFAAATAPAGTSTWSAIVAAARAGKLFANPNPLHLWFLEYLILYYVALGLIVPLANRLDSGAIGRASSWFRAVVASPWRVLWLALATTPVLAFSGMGTFGTPLSFVPDPVSFVAYGIYFAAGWGLYHQVDLLPDLARRARLTLALVPLALVLLAFAWAGKVVMLYGPEALIPPDATATAAAKADPAADDPAASPAARSTGSGKGMNIPGPKSVGEYLAGVPVALANGLVTWLLVLGITGIFLRYADRPSARMLYLTDASYFMYIVHFPLVVWIPWRLSGLDLPAVVKLGLVTIAAVALMLVVYDVAVRPTFIGAILNGRRRPRGLVFPPKARAAEVAA